MLLTASRLAESIEDLMKKQVRGCGGGCTGGVGGGAALLSAVGEKSSLDNALRWRGAINLCVNTEY